MWIPAMHLYCHPGFAAGPSHVLPTGRSSRFSSGLKLSDFLRRTSFIQYDAAAAKKALPVVSSFSRMEKLDAHGRALELRVDDEG